MMGIDDRYDPWQIPDNFFDYVKLVSRSDGIGRIPGDKLGTRIAIIGAGCAGLCAAYELVKIGLHPDTGKNLWPRSYIRAGSGIRQHFMGRDEGL
jgi:hypothetical protein